MENKNKKIYYGVGALILLVLVLFLFMKGNEKSEFPLDIEDIDVTETGEKVSDKDTSVPKKSEPVLTYAEALAKYKDYRIQLDERCQASPNNVTYKNGASIMIDNRSPLTRTVKVGSVYTIKGYGFKIVKLSSSALPAQWLVDCDKSQNVASILIQK